MKTKAKSLRDQDGTTEFKIEEHRPTDEPYYIPLKNEVRLFEIAYENQMPVWLKGPTGSGKSRFVEYMRFKTNKDNNTEYPLVHVPCHEDLTADDLKGRYLFDGTYQPGPALIAVERDGMLYLDEIVEARPDTTVVLHPLTDYRRVLVVEKLGKVYHAGKPFMVIASWNPGYQKKIKDLKQSTKQRGISIQFDYPPPKTEIEIILHESQVDEKTAQALAQIGARVRNSKGHGLEEGASTRLLIYAGTLIKNGIEPMEACRVAILNPITDNIGTQGQIQEGLAEIVSNFFGT